MDDKQCRSQSDTVCLRLSFGMLRLNRYTSRVVCFAINSISYNYASHPRDPIIFGEQRAKKALMPCSNSKADTGTRCPHVA